MKKITRLILPLLGLATTAALCWLLDGKQFAQVPLAFGRTLDPFHGFWQNMEGDGPIWDESVEVEGIQDKVTVRYDSLRIPHIFAQNAHDLYFMQGYVTARDRLWQMDMQTRAAAGRLSEVMEVEATVANDRARRRSGMVWAAERSLEAMNADPTTKVMVEAYSEGVNAYINSLCFADLPMEYKLLDFRPEPWSPIKSAFLLKFMAWDLTGRSEDFYNTNAAGSLGDATFDRIFPDLAPKTAPIVPKGTPFDFSPLQVQAPDSFSPAAVAPGLRYPQPDEMNGSNNWVVGPSKTANGHPILCNDPHLSLRAPSVWYEVQLSMPGMNVYGVSLPGSPAVIIGFNNDIAWGVTNASRDVQDWYKIEFKDGRKQEYRHDGKWLPVETRMETIGRRYSGPLVDTVRYTLHGPVVYDNDYTDPDTAGPMHVAMRWMGHDASNELLTFYLLNKGKSYDDYRKAISTYACPGQNFVFAAKNGDIALTQQGKFPVKWRQQGMFVMDGADKLHLWQAYIPAEQNPHAKNPAQGFIFSSNQHATDTTYPYQIYGNYDYTRNLRIQSALAGMSGVKVADMMRLQNDNYNELAALALPKLLASLQMDKVLGEGKAMKEKLASWNYMNDVEKEAPSIWQAWLLRIMGGVWEDDLMAIAHKAHMPEIYNTLSWLSDSLPLPEVDDRRTPAVETLADLATTTFNLAVKDIEAFSTESGLPYTWQNYNNVTVAHLTRQKPFGRERIPVGGGASIVNANRKNNGASWRMVVEMGESPDAYGVFPGGQSGNPGSPYYDRSIDDWAAGRYHKLLLLPDEKAEDKAITFTQTINPR